MNDIEYAVWKKDIWKVIDNFTRDQKKELINSILRTDEFLCDTCGERDKVIVGTACACWLLKYDKITKDQYQEILDENYLIIERLTNG